MIWLSLAFGWGLVGIWTGLTLLLLFRLISLLWRVRSGRWAVIGAPQSAPATT
jgi:Na+-driven multidrug efflux pump